MICVIDYGMGNLKSVSNALEYLNIPYMISNEKSHIESAKAILIPGVGAYYDAMKNLRDRGLDKIICNRVKSGTPILGICLGMQVLFEYGEEVENTKGLGLLPGIVKYMDIDLKVPHIGWNKISPNMVNPLINTEDYVYFVHSFYADTNRDIVAAYCDYGIDIPAIVIKGNVYGMQFHPEKSGDFGLELLKRFWEEVK